MLPPWFISAVDPSNLAPDSAAGKGLYDDLSGHQTVLLVGMLVVVHIIGIVALFGCLWNQTPKKVQVRRCVEEEKSEMKNSLSKHD